MCCIFIRISPGLFLYISHLDFNILRFWKKKIHLRVYLFSVFLYGYFRIFQQIPVSPFLDFPYKLGIFPFQLL